MPHSFLGITREPVYSPGKIEDDRAILEAVAERLAAHHDVRVIAAEEGLPAAPPRSIVFTMAQGPAALATLRSWEAHGVRIINTPDAVENCHRQRMVPAFERAGVPHPRSILMATDTTSITNAPLPEWVNGGAWIKRGDVHATEADDVVHVAGAGPARQALARFRSRGIGEAVVQQDVAGHVIKFYAVAGRFFAWFPHDATAPRLEGGEVDRLRQLAEHGAAALGLEVFGGDCVRRGPGDLWLIDLNDWPSYGRCRSAAADAISAYLTAQTA
jgi:hypothetical protein